MGKIRYGLFELMLSFSTVMINCLYGKHNRSKTLGFRTLGKHTQFGP